MLTKHHVSARTVIKPVKRSYAFELGSIPRKEQWVLKVKYPAADNQLPMGLTGAGHGAVIVCHNDWNAHIVSLQPAEQVESSSGLLGPFRRHGVCKEAVKGSFLNYVGRGE